MKIDHARDMFESTDLSSNMEDYLETIAVLSRAHRVVRVKDIAKSLKVKMPSVTAALGKLSEQGLVNYVKYGYVDLTERGKAIADKVYSRHECLMDFFSEVLRMDAETADGEACRMEHHLAPQSCRQLYKLVEYFKRADAQSPWRKELADLLDERPLSELSEGDEAMIVRIEAEGVLKKRLIELGFRRGASIALVRYAPLQDPLQVTIQKYSISLRVEEARAVIVKLKAKTVE